jgi:DNA mismatch repair protein MSH4
VNEVTMQSDSVIKGLLDRIREHIAAMFKVCEGIALVDMLTAFAHLATSCDYVRPDLGGSLGLKDARHPLLESARCPISLIAGCHS